jgi:hypothetical protein
LDFGNAKNVSKAPASKGNPMPWGYIKDISPHVLKSYDLQSPEPLDYKILITIYFE